MIKVILTVIALGLISPVFPQSRKDLDAGWKCINIRQLNIGGEKISQSAYALAHWMPATVPGTVLTTLINNKLMPHPFYGMNMAFAKK